MTNFILNLRKLLKRLAALQTKRLQAKTIKASDSILKAQEVRERATNDADKDREYLIAQAIESSRMKMKRANEVAATKIDKADKTINANRKDINALKSI